jgi:hypothetical protein
LVVDRNQFVADLLQPDVGLITRSASMTLDFPARPSSLAWSNPVAWWWGLLTLVSGVNIAVWFWLYRYLQEVQNGSLGSARNVELMLLFSAAYVFGCAFRSFLPRADVQRICLFDTWLSSVTVGRSVATVAEVCFAAQWAMVLYRLGTTTGAETTLNAAWVIVPLIVIAECFSWYAVLTRNFLCNAIENSLWGVCFLIIGVGLGRLLPDFEGLARLVLLVAMIGIAGYLAFLAVIDVPMYLTRWRTGMAASIRPLSPLEGLRDASVRWVVTHEFAEWKDEIAWMSLYFTGAVWSSLALCAYYAFSGHF